MSVSGVGEAIAAPMKSQEVIHITHDSKRRGTANHFWAGTDRVLVDKQDLKDYLSDYHHRHVTGNCKADGQEWPCRTYVALYSAAYGRPPKNA